MNDEQELYCKVYLHSEIERSQLLNLISSIIDGAIARRTITSTTLQADLISNEDYDELTLLASNPEFLYYRYYIEIEPAQGVPREHYIQSIGRLLEGLWQSNCKAVAACDFESSLPRNGGYEL